ncbi:MBL fold metallo-hydrolase [Candidatus Kaiserbacteria bacterium]|nr:MBL fold metallo-hydrolase [Candidatus Kaiserbacteria bacterium]
MPPKPPEQISFWGVIVRWGLLFVLLAGAVVMYVVPALERGGDRMVVTFLDVGQGDAIFIESPTGVQMLIDGGPDATVLRRLSQKMGFFDRSIDVVLATHADKDHIGGLADVLERYAVAEIVMTENKGESAAAEAFFERAEAEQARVTYARRGMQYDLGGGAILTILFPDRDPSLLESNTSSIVARLVYGDSEFLFTGDSPQAIEEHLVMLDRNIPSAGRRSELQSDVLKAGHHGSRTSSSELFLDAVRPTYAIISSGKDNSYGHPHKEVLAALAEAGVITKNTAEEGSITIVSDGSSLRLED